MPADSIKDIQIKDIQEYTDKIFAALNQDNPQQLLAELLSFGEFIGKHFPDKKNEEIYKILSQSAEDLPSYPLVDAAIINLGAITGIATRYYSDNEDKSNQSLLAGDDSLYRTYQAWKNAAVIFSHFAKKGQQTDLFDRLQGKTEEQINKWSLTVLGKVDKIVAERPKHKLAQSPLKIEDKEQEQVYAQQVATLQSVFKKYRELISVELKKAVLALPGKELAQLKDAKGNISINKVLGTADGKWEKNSDLAKCINKYEIIMELQGTLTNKEYPAIHKLNTVYQMLNNPRVKERLTSSLAEKKLWDTIVDIFRTFRVVGARGFFYAKHKKQTEQALTDALAMQKPSIT